MQNTTCELHIKGANVIIFISCVKQKLSKRAKAKDMYISSFFKKQLEYAKCLKPKNIFILSAKYGVLELDDVIEPYEKTLNNFSEREKKFWAYKCFKQLKKKKVDFKEKTVFLAGNNYRKYLMRKFSDVETPLKGLGIGEQLKFLKEKSCMQKPTIKN